MAIFNTRLRTKKDSESNWVSNNPILLDGEEVLSVQSDGSLRRKVGDGTSRYTALGYVGEHVAEADHAAEADQADYATSCGTASRATQLDSVRRINGVAFNGTKDITIYDPHMTPTVTKRLTATGWYRIASKTVAGTYGSGVLFLNRGYNADNAENYVLAFAQGHQRCTLNTLVCDAAKQLFTKLRYVYKDDKTPCYLEAYYAQDRANMCYSSMISLDGSYMSEAFTPGEIPEGYSVKEFEIPTAVESFTASDKVALDGKADAVDIVEDTSFSWTDFTYSTSESAFATVGMDSISAASSSPITIHCTGEMLGFTATASGGSWCDLKINGQVVMHSDGSQHGTTLSYTLPLTRMTEDIVIELSANTMNFTGMSRKKNKFVLAEQYNALLARVEALENRIGEVSPQNNGGNESAVAAKDTPKGDESDGT